MNKFIFFLFFMAATSTVIAQEDSEIGKEIPSEDTDTIDINDIDFDDIDFDEIEEDELSRESSFPWNKFAVGGQLGQLQFGDVTNIGVSPEIVYNLNDKVSFGVDGVLQITRINRIFDPFTRRLIDTDFSSGNTGGRLFTRIKPVSSFPIFAQLEYERLEQEFAFAQLQTGPNSITFPSVDQTVGNFGAGLGFNTGPSYVALIFNFNHNNNEEEFFNLADAEAAELRSQGFNIGNVNRDNNRVYPLNAIAFRTGINIPLGQGNKNKKRKDKKKDKDDKSKDN